MSAHTPGPWQWDGDYTLRPVNPDPEHSALHTIISPDGPFGFVQTATADVFPEFEADKLLIAAAPELLEALRECLKKGSKWHPCDPVVVQANAAIRAAEEQA